MTYLHQNRPSENNGKLLGEAIRPRLATDEGQKVLAGQARIDEIRVRLFLSSSSSLASCSCLFLIVLCHGAHPRTLQLISHHHYHQSCFTLETSPAAQHFSKLPLKFLWEEISTPDLQTDLQALFASNSCLQNSTLLAKILPYLTVSVMCEAEQASAKDVICDLFGLVTRPQLVHLRRRGAVSI